jgi:transposase
VATLCEQLPVKHVALYYGLKWDAVKAMHKTYLELTMGPPDLDGLEVLAMDEFAVQKGHRYATVILDYKTRRVVWVSRNRDRESVREFFKLLGPQRCKEIRAVAMDMTASYAAEVKEHCPQAEVVYDMFHVAAKYSREVIDRVRVDEANAVGNEKKDRKVIKSARWLLLRNRDTIKKAEDRVRLDELLAVNKNLLKVYVLKDDLKELWKYVSPGHARNAWKSWKQRAMRSGLEPLKAFARKLEAYMDGIIAHCRHAIHTSVLEGVNNKIKVIKRMAYGFRDDEYFFLRIRAAFPGNAG